MGDGGGLTFSGATAGYEDDPQAKLCNQTCVDVFRALHAADPPNTQHYILEIGSGTGGTTSFCLPTFNPHTTKYVFSDLSQAFLTNARLRFGNGFPFIEYCIFNGDKQPGEQGFYNYQMNQILATNVIHATMHLASTMATCHSLLAPGGHIIFNEVQNGGTLGEDLTFGLTDGWWMLTDCERRVTYPLLKVPEWLSLFSSCSFTPVWHTPDSGEFFSQQSVMCARVNSADTPRTQNGIDVNARLDPSATYLITGAVGGLGLISALVMIEMGAKHLHFVSRRDRVPTEAQQWYARVAASSCTVKRQRCNVASAAEVAKCIMEDPKAPPLQGVVHGAGVLSDGTIPRQNRQKFQEVFGPKAFGSWHAHRFTANSARPLQLHVAFASGAGFFGSPGQSNHSSANVCLDAQRDWNCSLGVAGGCISWGAVAQVGYAARHNIATEAIAVSFEHAWAVLEQLHIFPCSKVAINPGSQFSGYGKMPMVAATFNGCASRFRRAAPMKAPKAASSEHYLQNAMNKGPAEEVVRELPEVNISADDPAGADYSAVVSAMQSIIGNKADIDQVGFGQQEVC